MTTAKANTASKQAALAGGLASLLPNGEEEVQESVMLRPYANSRDEERRRWRGASEQVMVQLAPGSAAAAAACRSQPLLLLVAASREDTSDLLVRTVHTGYTPPSPNQPRAANVSRPRLLMHMCVLCGCSLDEWVALRQLKRARGECEHFQKAKGSERWVRCMHQPIASLVLRSPGDPLQLHRAFLSA